MDELSDDQLRELEEQLYSQVHHQVSIQPTLLDVVSEREERQERETENTKFLSNRYWFSRNKSNKTLQQAGEKFEQCEEQVQIMLEKQKDNMQSKTPKMKEQPKIHNPFRSLPKQKQRSSSPKHVQFHKGNFGEPFSRQAQQLQRAVKYENKKRKSRTARLTMEKLPMVTETVVLESSDENDEEVIVVPAAPDPVYNVDDSDDDEEAKKSEPPHKAATDAFITPNTKKSSPTTSIINDQASDTASRCNSPNSVISQDEFIGQTDRQRLLKSGTIADDTDLLILTNIADSLQEPLTPPEGKTNGQDSANEIECIGTFIKPTITGFRSTPQGNKKQSYNVDKSGFQAMDVYESESDIMSGGVYSKGNLKSQPPTTIRNIDNSSSSEMDATTPIQAKTKRLRKRRASGSIRGSESNGGSDSSDTPEDVGVGETAVPFIARGPAVESCKSKRLRKRTASTSAAQGNRSYHMPDSEFMATLNSLAQGSNNNEAMCTSNEEGDSEIENLPSARDIAETVINQEQVAIPTLNQTEGGRADPQSVSIDRNCTETKNNCNDAVPSKIADDIEKLFDKINEFATKKAIEISDEDDCQVSVESHIGAASDVSIAVTGRSISDVEKAAADSKIKYFISYAPSNAYCISDGFGWNEEMSRFYNNSWGGENIRVENILRQMNRDRRLWTIMDTDRMMFYNKRDRRDKCVNCFSFGHIRARCPQPRKPIICYMCGQSGHTESCCPNTCCLKCGSKTTLFSPSCKKCMYWNNRICPICKFRGHSLNDCPDKWRRYHSTTKPNVYPNSRVIYNKRRYCCFCGRRGHLSDECNKAMYRTEYPMISSEIKSHEKSYDDAVVRSPHRQEIPCRLLYDPNVKFNFELAAKTTHKNVYGRFLSAVGLEHLIGVQIGSQKHIPVWQTLNLSNKTNELEQPTCSNISPEQVSEVSESTNETSLETSESLKMPPPRPPNHTTTAGTTDVAIDHDSDSNYSFSDHFEVPSTSTQCAKTAPLPDFISLKNSEEQKFMEQQDDSSNKLIQLDKNNRPNFGISAKYADLNSDEEDPHIPPKLSADDNIPGEIPCEAKIYISNEHSMYFQSKPGQKYLNQIMLDNNLTGNLNKTIVGYALFIHGLPGNQEKLQRELELKFKSLNDEKTQQCETSSKVPRNVNVLIRFLRDSINELYRNLGNASELYTRLLDLDKNNSKSSVKSAERIRRTLNMIFLGQAGLFDGDKHIDTLLNGLHILVNNFEQSEKTPEDLRNTIDFSWRMLFTSYHHRNYSQLLLEYLKIPPGARNRMSKRQIELSLLGKPKLNLKIKVEQKSNSNEYTKLRENTGTNTKTVEEGTLLLNVVSLNDKVKNQENQKITEKRQQDANTTLYTNVGEKQTTTVGRLNDKHYQDLISEIAKSPNRGEKGHNSVSKDSKMPSMFWSRESQRFLKELINSASDNPTTLQRLQRINTKATAGGLSYNDYRSVIELYNVTIKINKK